VREVPPDRESVVVRDTDVGATVVVVVTAVVVTSVVMGGVAPRRPP